MEFSVFTYIVVVAVVAVCEMAAQATMMASAIIFKIKSEEIVRKIKKTAFFFFLAIPFTHYVQLSF